MRSFITSFLFFCSIVCFLIITCALLPPTPRSKSSLLFSKTLKDSLFNFQTSPRLILIGGSNLSFGINSALLRDSLRINPINDGIQGSIGLSFLLRNRLKSIRAGDVVVVAAEYNNFFGDFSWGQEPLLRTVLDVDRGQVSDLSVHNLLHILPYLPKYSFSKLKPSEYFFKTSRAESIYLRSAFNQFGDACAHWDLPNRKYEPEGELSGEFNHKLIKELVDFEKTAKSKGARVFISFPPFDERSYALNKQNIHAVESSLTNRLAVISHAADYCYSTNLMFNTSYHLNGKGVEIRTKQLIRDLRLALFN